jgi:hypothetical protein
VRALSRASAPRHRVGRSKRRRAAIAAGALLALGSAAAAIVEPTDALDLLSRRPTAALPARPPLPEGHLVFPSLVAPSFSRRVDLETGAPLRATGAETCALRSGWPHAQLATIGNCLLFDPPRGTDTVQPLRGPEAIAHDHAVNQTLFHLLAALHADEDVGFALLDASTAPALSEALAKLLTGNPAGAVAIQGARTIRTAGTALGSGLDRATGDPVVVQRAFGRLRSAGADTLDALDFRVRSLLGCGPSFAHTCNGSSLGGSGIDLMNALGAAIVQEFTLVKLASQGRLVGAREGSFEPGVSRPRGFSVSEAQAAGADAATAASERIAADADRFELAPGDTGAADGAGLPLVTGPAVYGHGGFVSPTTLSLRERAAHPLHLLFDLADGQSLPRPTDILIEGPRWRVDPAMQPRQGVRFLDPRQQPSGHPLDPARMEVRGENCAALHGGPEPGCSDLELVSANLERWLIANEILGDDDYFDPPESPEELAAMLDGDPSNDANGDPISGPDGIFFGNFDLDGDGLAESKAVKLHPAVAGIADADFVVALERCSRTRICYRTHPLFDPNLSALVFVIPIGIPGYRRNAPGEWEPYFIPADQLRRLDLQRLVDADQTVGCPAGSAVCSIVQADTDGDHQPDTVLAADAGVVGSLSSDPLGPLPVEVDLDQDQDNDLDLDRDGRFDFLDDGTPGPVSDDNVLCGSGIPGDLLQEALQTEYADSADATAPGAAAIPLRSPTFCRDPSLLLSLVGESGWSPVDFVWHGGATDLDLDQDAVPDHRDACLLGDDSADADGDRIADACDPCPLGFEPGEDGDGVCAAGDNCPTVSNPDQSDRDGDRVGDACDNCVEVPNPRSARRTSQTLTGGQHDGDADGVGNACDADFDGRSRIVNSADLALLKKALRVSCHTGPLDPEIAVGGFDRFDLDGSGTLDAADVALFRALFGRRPGPTCPACRGAPGVIPCEGPACSP